MNNDSDEKDEKIRELLLHYARKLIRNDWIFTLEDHLEDFNPKETLAFIYNDEILDKVVYDNEFTAQAMVNNVITNWNDAQVPFETKLKIVQDIQFANELLLQNLPNAEGMIFEDMSLELAHVDNFVKKNIPYLLQLSLYDTFIHSFD